MKLFEAVLIAVSGALLGGFLGKLLATTFPSGKVHDLFAGELVAGLHPTNLDLRVIDLTFGCMFHLNLMSVVGIVLAAVVYKKLVR